VEVTPPSPAEATASDTFRLELEHTDVIVNNWTDFPVKLEPDQPVMTGLRAELPHARDELWHGVRGPAEEMELLATAWSPVTQAHEPMLWTVRYGKGRVFMTLLGHDAEAMRDLTFRFTLARGAEWAATGKTTLPVPAGLASATATETIEVSGSI
jgi:uncharacterized protein